MISESSKLSLVIPLAIALGAMLSPESLVILGNGMGSAGTLFLAFLALAMLAHFLTVLSYEELFALHPGGADETFLLYRTFGSAPATVLPICSKVMFAICASTGILATAGYVFNEVFVYWFPNLGFSFCVLALLLVINLLGRKVATIVQIILVSVPLIGLTLLILAGSLELGTVPEVERSLNFPPLAMTRVASMGFLLFMGHELATLAKRDKEDCRRGLALHLICAIGLMGVVFAAWGLVSLKHVTMERLADTSIPHVIAAREIFGHNGRIIMGIVVIAGALSAVNGLLFSVSRMMSNMARTGLMPAFLARKSKNPSLGIVLLTLGIASMMGLGMAGEPVLEIYIRSAFLFWLLTYSAVHLGVLLSRRRSSPDARESWAVGRQPGVSVVGLLVTLGSFAGLLWTGPEPVEVVKFMLTLGGVLTIFVLVWQRLGRSQDFFARIKLEEQGQINI